MANTIPMVLRQGVLPEPMSNDEGVALWLPSARMEGFQQWERVRSSPQTRFIVESGITAAAASLISARQPLPSFWSKLKMSCVPFSFPLYDFRSRAYSPSLGRWTQTDPLTDRQVTAVLSVIPNGVAA